MKPSRLGDFLGIGSLAIPTIYECNTATRESRVFGRVEM